MKTEVGERSLLLLLLTTCAFMASSTNTSITGGKEVQNVNESEFHT